MDRSPAAIVRAADAAVLGAGDLAAIEEQFAPDYVAHGTERTLRGPGAVRAFAEALLNAFTVLEVEILAEAEARVAWQRTVRATHAADFMGFPATGRRIVWRDVVTSRFRDGQGRRGTRAERDAGAGLVDHRCRGAAPAGGQEVKRANVRAAARPARPAVAVRKDLAVRGCRIAVAAAWLLGCQGSAPGDDPAGSPPAESAAESPAAAQAAVRTAALDLPRNATLLDSVTIDVTGDDAPEAVELYVTAERGRDGAVLWEDGHRWLLVVRSPGRHHVLLDTFVPFGVVRFWILDDAEGARRIAIETDSSTGGLTLTTYAFDSSASSFVARSDADISGRIIHRTRPESYR